MTEQPSKRRTSPFIVWPLCLFFFGVLYFASFGPVAWLHAHGWISFPTFDFIRSTVYFPVVWINQNTELFNDNPIGGAYARYVEWCSQ